MTTEVKKSLFSAAGVLVCIGALGLGAIWRDRVDFDGSSHLDMSSLVASTSDRTELPETRFFEDIKELLKRKYVDPIGDDTKLADGAVRGMVASLGDPNSLYMDPEQFRVYGDVRAGKYEGIGADLILARDKPQTKVQVGAVDEVDDANARLPKLMIAAIVPGSSADKAGLKPGDWAEFVDDHWIPNSDAFDRFLALDSLVAKQKAAAQAAPNLSTAYVKSSEEYLKMRRLLRDEADKRILAIKARDRLMMGDADSVKTQWVRGQQRIQVTLAKGRWVMPGFAELPDGSIRLPFVEDSAEKLQDAIRGKKDVTIDLRGNPEGDFDAMLACLKTVAPSGTYGYLVTHRDEKPVPLTISDGAKEHPRLTLLVDSTTRGAAEIFADALSSRGLAKVVGPEMGGDRYQIRWYQLPDKAGYSLVTAEYRPNAPTGVLAKSAVVDHGAFSKDGLRPSAAKFDAHRDVQR